MADITNNTSNGRVDQTKTSATAQYIHVNLYVSFMLQMLTWQLTLGKTGNVISLFQDESALLTIRSS